MNNGLGGWGGGAIIHKNRLFYNYNALNSTGGLAVPSPSVQSYVYRPPGIFSPTSATTQQPISAANATNATHQSQQQHTATAAALNSSANVLPDCDCRYAFYHSKKLNDYQNNNRI